MDNELEFNIYAQTCDLRGSKFLFGQVSVFYITLNLSRGEHGQSSQWLRSRFTGGAKVVGNVNGRVILMRCLCLGLLRSTCHLDISFDAQMQIVCR